MNIYLKEYEGKYLELRYDSKYSSGAIGITTPAELVKAIEEVCGKGSYCLYEGKGQEYPKAVDYFKSKDLVYPTITYWQQGVKTQVIEQCRDIAEKIWGDIPEMRIGWLEDQCKSYIEDLK